MKQIVSRQIHDAMKWEYIKAFIYQYRIIINELYTDRIIIGEIYNYRIIINEFYKYRIITVIYVTIY